MGRNGRQRRAEQRRRREQRRAAANVRRPAGHRGRHGAVGGPVDPVTMFWAAVASHGRGDEAATGDWIDAVARSPVEPLAIELDALFGLQLRRLWDDGWQPEVLHHVIRRECGAAPARELVDALAAQAEDYEILGRDVAPEWMAQLASLDAVRRWSGRRPRLAQTPGPWGEHVRALVSLMHLLAQLPALPVVAPPPSAWRAGGRPRHDEVSADVLRRVRSLLAKAESSTFDAEAETFTAKAQEMMARHRIDRALLDADPLASESEVIGRRIAHDDPYAESKAILLATVCLPNGGYAVYSKAFGFSTVFAPPVELDMIEDLYTSLLIQATAAMRREGAEADQTGHRRTARFRRAFLAGFAHRIGVRLTEVVDRTVADVERDTGSSVALVLADRAERARDAAERSFPAVASRTRSVTDRAGWEAGQRFGDRADLGVGPPVERRAAS